MAGISHSTNQNQVSGLKFEPLHAPAVWPLQATQPAQAEVKPQIFTEGQPLPTSRRLVVILPDANIDLLTLPKRIWSLASPDQRHVLLLIRPCQEENEFHARVNLTTLAAVIRDPFVPVETHLVLGQSLEQAARQVAQPDDVFVCFAEHQVKGLFGKRSLAEMLAQKTGQPVYTLDGTVEEMVDPLSARLIDFFFLALSLISLIAFFILEVWIERNSAGTFKMILQILAVCAEVWVIGAFANKSFRI